MSLDESSGIDPKKLRLGCEEILKYSSIDINS